MANSPSQHRYISEAEQKYIETSIGAVVNDSQPNRPFPWKKMITSVPAWAIIVCTSCTEWGTATMITNTPTFMKEVLKFDIQQVSVVTDIKNKAIPYWTILFIMQLRLDRNCHL